MGFILARFQDIADLSTLTLAGGQVYVVNSGNTAWEVKTPALLDVDGDLLVRDAAVRNVETGTAFSVINTVDGINTLVVNHASTGGHYQVTFNSNNADGNTKDFAFLNNGQNVMGFWNRPSFGIYDWAWGYSGLGRIRVFGDMGGANINRLEFYTNETWLNGVVYVVGGLNLSYVTDATSLAAQGVCTAVINFTPTWYGPGATINNARDACNMRLLATGWSGVEGGWIWGVYNQNGVGYSGIGFGVFLRDWRNIRTGGGKSPHIGLNNANPTAHLDIVEDDAGRVVLQLELASGQTASSIKILDNGGSVLFELDKDGKIAKVGGVAPYNGTFNSSNTVTVTKGIITGVA